MVQSKRHDVGVCGLLLRCEWANYVIESKIDITRAQALWCTYSLCNTSSIVTIIGRLLYCYWHAVSSGGEGGPYICIFGWIGEACGVQFDIEKAAHDVQLSCWVSRPYHRSQALRITPLVCCIIVSWRRRRCNYCFICSDATDEATCGGFEKPTYDRLLRASPRWRWKHKAHPWPYLMYGWKSTVKTSLRLSAVHYHPLQRWWTSSGSKLHISTHLERC